MAKVKKDPQTGKLHVMWKGWRIDCPEKPVAGTYSVQIEEGMQVTVSDFNPGMGYYRVFASGRSDEGWGTLWLGPIPVGPGWSGERKPAETWGDLERLPLRKIVEG